jgi:hypothetical protein
MCAPSTAPPLPLPDEPSIGAPAAAHPTTPCSTSTGWVPPAWPIFVHRSGLGPLRGTHTPFLGDKQGFSTASCAIATANCGIRAPKGALPLPGAGAETEQGVERQLPAFYGALVERVSRLVAKWIGGFHP